MKKLFSLTLLALGLYLLPATPAVAHPPCLTNVVLHVNSDTFLASSYDNSAYDPSGYWMVSYFVHPGDACNAAIGPVFTVSFKQNDRCENTASAVGVLTWQCNSGPGGCPQTLDHCPVEIPGGANSISFRIVHNADCSLTVCIIAVATCVPPVLCVRY
jgi:hypothetical protein